MHDIRTIRDDPAAFDRALARRGLPARSVELLALDAGRRAAQQRLNELQARRNELSGQVGRAKSKGEDATALMAEVARLKDEMTAAEAQAAEADAALDRVLAEIPNLPASDVPEGRDEHGNKEVRRWGDQRNFDFAPKQHFEVGEALGLMDFETAAKIAGARFVLLKGQLARLERALASFMLDLHTGEFGYTEAVPPYLVRDESVYGTGQLPKFAEDLFRTTDGRWLIPTAEVPLTNIAADAILEEAALPLRFTAYSPCFRSEAGAAGKDTRGMIRQHQFSKVELVSIAHPDRSEAEHERMTACAEEVLKRLKLPYRVMLLCSGDMGFSSRKTYDIEVWLPGQGAYREISSCSNCGDFQARRMKGRYRPTGDKKGTRFVHTLNGSGLAIGRTMVAIIENYQEKDGSVRLPDALRPYMNGAESITRHG
ncbi:MAG TPA: serine--tRNA ligase [Hypericibacter adhaerens]|jgi:seryl-tRNA synthetase|uniref:serine--tRNA ligase n=1 Tax=Hypericibacter adhaerens TaxID=2602016 RepID=UPI002BAFAE06|nr:serine--tRNA ligase [Hypericibacter adhaerens]HWA43227.1 serine--tRNA ligase [Hypericibacter adhaerens]